MAPIAPNGLGTHLFMMSLLKNKYFFQLNIFNFNKVTENNMNQHNNDFSNRSPIAYHMYLLTSICVVIASGIIFYDRAFRILDISSTLPLYIRTSDILISCYLSFSLIFCSYIVALEHVLGYNWREKGNSSDKYILQWLIKKLGYDSKESISSLGRYIVKCFVKCNAAVTIILVTANCLHFLFYSQWLWNDCLGIGEIPITSFLFVLFCFLTLHCILDDIEKLSQNCGWNLLFSKKESLLFSKKGKELATAAGTVIIPATAIYVAFSKQIVEMLFHSSM